MAYKPIESGVIAILLADSAVAAICGDRVFPVIVPQGEARPAVTVARVVTDREPETIESDRVPAATLEIRGIASSYQVAASVAKACREALQVLPSTLGDHDVMLVQCSDELDQFEADTAESGGFGFYHRVLKYVVEYYE
jgi:hypothetical protein